VGLGLVPVLLDGSLDLAPVDLLVVQPDPIGGGRREIVWVVECLANHVLKITKAHSTSEVGFKPPHHALQDLLIVEDPKSHVPSFVVRPSVVGVRESLHRSLSFLRVCVQVCESSHATKFVLRQRLAFHVAMLIHGENDVKDSAPLERNDFNAVVHRSLLRDRGEGSL